MILANKTLMCPMSDDMHRHPTPIIISVKLGWNSRGPTIMINLTCPDCGWKVNKEISLLKMMERTSLCPTNEGLKTGSKAF